MVGSRAVGWALVLISLAAVVLIDKVGRVAFVCVVFWGMCWWGCGVCVEGGKGVKERERGAG